MNSLKKHGLECTEDNMIYGGFWMECADKLAKDIAYEVLDRPDAVLCYDDEIAFFFIKALSRHGIRVPEDISCVGYDGIHLAKVMRLTTYSQNAAALGRTAAERLISLIEHPKTTLVDRINTPELHAAHEAALKKWLASIGYPDVTME